MQLLVKLILREAWYHRARLSLAVLATAAMSAMLVWLIGSIGLVVLQFDNDGEKFLGNFHTAMIPQRGDEPAEGAAPAPMPMTPRPPLFVNQKVIDELKANELVMQVSPAVQIRNTMAKWKDENSVLERQRSGLGVPMGSPPIIGIDANETPFELEEGKWFSAGTNGAGEMEGVMATSAARSLSGWGQDADPVKVGDYVQVRINEKEFKIKIVGLVEMKQGGGMRSFGGVSPIVSGVFVSKQTAEKLAAIIPAAAAGQGMASNLPLLDENGKLNAQYLYVRLREGADVKRFKNDWKEHLAAEGFNFKFIDADDIQASLTQVSGGRGGGGLMGGASSMSAIIIFTTLISVLIVFTALSMGVNERTRVFAMMRTAGMERRHIAALIFGESVILCLLGWIVGLAAGWLVLQISVWTQPGVYGTGKTVSLGLPPILTSGFAALIGAFAAAIVPMWRGTKIEPLEGMNRGYLYNIKSRQLLLAGFIGALLLAVNPLIIYYGVNAETSTLRLALYSYLGLPTQILGLVLLVPAVVIFVEKFFAPLVAKILCIEKNLLKNQLSANLWRTLGTAVALTIGLGVYSFLEISGYSMLVPFTHSGRLPNSLAAFMPKGLPWDKIDLVKELDGVDKNSFLPIALEQPLFPPDEVKKFLDYGMSDMQANAGIVVFGLDIDKAFSPNTSGAANSRKRFVDVDLIEGTWDDALAKLKTGKQYCIIPDSFAFRARLHVGNKIQLVKAPQGRGGRGGMGMGGGRGRGQVRPPAGGDSQFPSRGGAGTLENSPSEAGELNGQRPPMEMGRGGMPPWMKPVEYEVCGVVTVPGWLWMAKLSGIRKYGYRSGALMFAPFDAVKNDFKIDDAAYFWFDRAGNVPDAELEKTLQKLADGFSTSTNGADVSRPMVKLSSHEYLNDRVGSRADQVIQAAAKIPLILLMISSLAMVGTVAASIRTRRFELGVLRCLGVTRFGLVRLILAEAFLIALASSIISIGFGILGAWCFIGLARYVSFFGGFINPLTIPWYYLSIGFALTLGLCGLAAVFPAIAAGRKEPASLLHYSG